MKKIVLFLLTVSLFSCGGKIYDRKELIDYKTNNNVTSLKLDGYYYNEYEIENDFRNLNFRDSVAIKSINTFFFYEDGFALKLSADGVSLFYCSQNKLIENTYVNAHRNIIEKVEAQNSTDKKIRRACDFGSNDIHGKGLIEIKGDSIRIQYYALEYKKPNVPISAHFLNEMSGVIINDSTFVIKELKTYKDDKVKNVDFTYKFRKSKKPVVSNYFKEHM